MSDRHPRGFTLVELLVSLAILSIALAVLFGAISDSLDRARKGRNETLAASLVQSLLARAGSERAPDAGDASGVYSNGFRWRIVVSPYGSGDDAKARNILAFRIEATVSWRDGAQDHARTLTGLRLVPPKKPS
ncbi:MAG TPA: type II secretion system protein [Rhizomicrobium sp.]